MKCSLHALVIAAVFFLSSCVTSQPQTSTSTKPINSNLQIDPTSQAILISSGEPKKKHSFFQPEGPTADVTFSVPNLRSVLWTDNWVDITFYDGCNSGWARDNGVLGGFKLSSKPNHKYGKEHTVKLAAGKPAIFEMGMISGYVCTGKFRFTPEVGHHYKFLYDVLPGGCVADGVDVLEDGQVIEISGLERFKNKDTFFGLVSASGDRDTAWRKCGKMKEHRVE